MRVSVFSALGLIVFATAVSSCGEPTASPSASTTAAVNIENNIPEGYVTTPAGLYHSSCVHEVPEGARVEKNGLVRRRDNSVFQAATRCLFPVRNARHADLSNEGERHEGLRSTSANPTANGWIEYAQLSSSNDFSQITANWTVPTPPLTPYIPSQTYFTFPGIESDSFIIQPVIQFGTSGAGGGQYWGMASWQCGPPGGCYHSPLKIISHGDLIHGSISSGCTGGNCLWSITTKDLTTGDTTNFSTIDTDQYYLAFGGSVEVYNLNSCDAFPINGVGFSAISLLYKNGTQVSPSWFSVLTSGVVPACGYSVSSTPSTVALSHNANSTTVTAKGGLRANCGLCNSYIISVVASGNTIAIKDNGGHTGNIVLTGATATGGLTASCMFCNNIWIKSFIASGHTITVQDADGHTGTITVSGATLSSMSGGLVASCGGLCNNPHLVEISALGANGISTVSDGGNNASVRFQ
jgi:hypothetical protein